MLIHPHWTEEPAKGRRDKMTCPSRRGRAGLPLSTLSPRAESLGSTQWPLRESEACEHMAAITPGQVNTGLACFFGVPFTSLHLCCFFGSVRGRKTPGLFNNAPWRAQGPWEDEGLGGGVPMVSSPSPLLLKRLS